MRDNHSIQINGMDTLDHPSVIVKYLRANLPYFLPGILFFFFLLLIGVSSLFNRQIMDFFDLPIWDYFDRPLSEMCQLFFTGDLIKYACEPGLWKIGALAGLFMLMSLFISKNILSYFKLDWNPFDSVVICPGVPVLYVIIMILLEYYDQVYSHGETIQNGFIIICLGYFIFSIYNYLNYQKKLGKKS